MTLGLYDIKAKDIRQDFGIYEIRRKVITS
jgi:hypothetical protein